MAFQEFDPALTLPVNFTVRDNPFEDDEDSCFGTINPRRIQ